MGCGQSRDTEHPDQEVKASDDMAQAATSAPASSLPRCFLDIIMDGQPAGRMVLELRPDVAPKTVENFVGLCRREDGYRGTTLHRIIPGFMVQGGSCGMSVFGQRFADESFQLTHDQRGCLSMANQGPDTNNTQFFITFAPTPHLDGKHVVFGRVVEGMNVVDMLEEVGSRSGKTSREVIMQDCGQL